MRLSSMMALPDRARRAVGTCGLLALLLPQMAPALEIIKRTSSRVVLGLSGGEAGPDSIFALRLYRSPGIVSRDTSAADSGWNLSGNTLYLYGKVDPRSAISCSLRINGDRRRVGEGWQGVQDGGIVVATFRRSGEVAPHAVHYADGALLGILPFDSTDNAEVSQWFLYLQIVYQLRGTGSTETLYVAARPRPVTQVVRPWLQIWVGSDSVYSGPPAGVCTVVVRSDTFSLRVRGNREWHYEEVEGLRLVDGPTTPAQDDVLEFGISGNRERHVLRLMMDDGGSEGIELAFALRSPPFPWQWIAAMVAMCAVVLFGVAYWRRWSPWPAVAQRMGLRRGRFRFVLPIPSSEGVRRLHSISVRTERRFHEPTARGIHGIIECTARTCHGRRDGQGRLVIEGDVRTSILSSTEGWRRARLGVNVAQCTGEGGCCIQVAFSLAVRALAGTPEDRLADWTVPTDGWTLDSVHEQREFKASIPLLSSTVNAPGPVSAGEPSRQGVIFSIDNIVLSLPPVVRPRQDARPGDGALYLQVSATGTTGLPKVSGWVWFWHKAIERPDEWTGAMEVEVAGCPATDERREASMVVSGQLMVNRCDGGGNAITAKLLDRGAIATGCTPNVGCFVEAPLIPDEITVPSGQFQDYPDLDPELRDLAQWMFAAESREAGTPLLQGRGCQQNPDASEIAARLVDEPRFRALVKETLSREFEHVLSGQASSLAGQLLDAVDDEALASRILGGTRDSDTELTAREQLRSALVPHLDMNAIRAWFAGYDALDPTARSELCRLLEKLIGDLMTGDLLVRTLERAMAAVSTPELQRRLGHAIASGLDRDAIGEFIVSLADWYEAEHSLESGGGRKIEAINLLSKILADRLTEEHLQLLVDRLHAERSARRAT